MKKEKYHSIKQKKKIQTPPNILTAFLLHPELISSLLVAFQMLGNHHVSTTPKTPKKGNKVS